MASEANFRHLVRVANTDLDGSKSISIALTKIKGCGKMFANMLCSLAGVDKSTKAGVLPAEQVKRLEEILQNPAKFDVPAWMLNRRRDAYDGIDKHLIVTDLAFQKENDIKLLKKIRCYRGIRHMSNLPVRGQKTRSNFRRNKGKVQGVKKKGKAKKSGK